METERKQQSWRIHISAKAHNFNFKLRLAAATYAPTWTLSFFRLSVLLNLPKKFVFRIRSEPKQERGFFATKVMKIVHKFRPRWPKNRSNNIAAKTQSKSNLSLPKFNLTNVIAGSNSYWLLGYGVCSMSGSVYQQQ
ncbi:hypothetical protein SESBI_24498 [Sesbania bispinosa]|nr:hypothetical protein SESBI_24498 [Sesbania bispinosa]